MSAIRWGVRLGWLLFYTISFAWLLWEPIAYLQWWLRPAWGYHSGFGFFSGQGRIMSAALWLYSHLISDASRGVVQDVRSHNTGRVTLRGALIMTLGNLLAGRIFTGTGLSRYVSVTIGDRWLTWLDGEKILPDMIPAKIFNAVDDLLTDLTGAQCSADAHSSSADEFYWYIAITYTSGFDPAAILRLQTAIEDRLSRYTECGAVTILQRPIRIKIARNIGNTITLAGLWPDVVAAQTNQRLALIGSNGAPVYLPLTGEQASGLISGRPGAGKSQMALSLILSMCMTNAPAALRIIIIDTKQADFPPLATLPHVEVIKNAEMAANVIAGLVNEMEGRRGRRGHQAVMLYVDELADLLNELGDRGNTVVTHLQRLAQLGRALDVIVYVATQRVFAISAGAYALMGVRLVGKVRNAGDSTAATGVAGSQCHRLPGKGAFEVYGALSLEDGARVQGAFVADSGQPDYAQKLQPFIDSVIERWGNKQPEADIIPEEISGFPTRMIYEAIRLYIHNALSQYQARKLSQELRGVDMNDRMFERFLQTVREVAATEIAERLHLHYSMN